MKTSQNKKFNERGCMRVVNIFYISLLPPEFKNTFLNICSCFQLPKSITFLAKGTWAESNGILSQNFQKRTQPCKENQNFLKTSSWAFQFHSILPLEFLGFSVEHLVDISESQHFRIFWKLFQEISVPFTSVPKFLEFLVELKACSYSHLLT